ncbi:DinB family protein [Myroides pelagicus]
MKHDYYISLTANTSVLQMLTDRIVIVNDLFDKIETFDKWSYTYAEGKWTIKQLIQHLIDCERIFSFRVLHIIRHDKTPLFGFDENVYAEFGTAEIGETEDLKNEYLALMRSIYFMYKRLSREELAIRAQIIDYEISIEEIGLMMAGHCLHHLRVIEEIYL